MLRAGEGGRGWGAGLRRAVRNDLHTNLGVRHVLNAALASGKQK